MITTLSPHIKWKMNLCLTRKLLATFPVKFLDGGSIEGVVTGVRRYSREAGGMEIPCELTFTGKKKNITKLRRLIANLNSNVIFYLYIL